VKRRRARGDPLASIPAELDEFDPREWAAPGEDPDYATWHAVGPADRRGMDYYACSQWHQRALLAWFDAHPQADFLTWINRRWSRPVP